MMEEFNFEESLMINAEVAYNIREKYNNEGRILYAYVLLNTYADSYKQKLYADAIQKHLSEEDFGKVIAETSFGKFDNLSFWVNKSIKDMEEYSMFAAGYRQKSFMEDAVKGAFFVFVDTVWTMSNKAAELLLEAIGESDILSFLKPVAFYKKEQLKTLEYVSEKSEEENYLDLLELEFSPYEIFYDLQTANEDDVRTCAINQKKQRKHNPEVVATQMSFKHLF